MKLFRDLADAEICGTKEDLCLGNQYIVPVFHWCATISRTKFDKQIISGHSAIFCQISHVFYYSEISQKLDCRLKLFLRVHDILWTATKETGKHKLEQRASHILPSAISQKVKRICLFQFHHDPDTIVFPEMHAPHPGNSRLFLY